MSIKNRIPASASPPSNFSDPGINDKTGWNILIRHAENLPHLKNYLHGNPAPGPNPQLLRLTFPNVQPGPFNYDGAPDPIMASRLERFPSDQPVSGSDLPTSNLFIA